MLSLKQQSNILMTFSAHIPNIITILNLLSGSIALLLLFEGQYLLSAIFVGTAAVFDFLDGMVAKLLNSKSLIGKELDSLADVISFGLVPAMFLYFLMKQSNIEFNEIGMWLPFLALAIGAFSALRLAKFNLDTRQTVSFIGMPTPANAILIISFCMVAFTGNTDHKIVQDLVNNIWIQAALVPLSCFLLVSEIPMFSLKFHKGIGFRKNAVRYSFLAITAISTLLWGWTGVTFSMLIYIIMSLVFKDK